MFETEGILLCPGDLCIRIPSQAGEQAGTQQGTAQTDEEKR